MGRRIVWVFAACALAAVASAQPETPPIEEGQTSGQQESLPALGIEIDGRTHLLTDIDVVGLQNVDARDLWAAVRRPKTPCSFTEAARLIRDLGALGTFARVEARLRVAGAGAVSLEIRLTEHPLVREVRVRGLTEVADSQVVADLLGGPPEGTAGAAVPAWFATLGGDGIHRGILRGGLKDAVRRVMSGLFGAGYRMANASGVLSSDGVLTIDVDEGRIGTVEVVGPTSRVARLAERLLALPPGRTFLEADVSEATKLVERELPFLQVEQASRATRALPLVDVTPEPDGGERFALRGAPATDSTAVFAIEGHSLRVYFRAATRVRVSIPTDDLLRNTPVGGVGFAPSLRLAVFDPKNRVHLRVDSFSAAMDEQARQVVGTDIGEYGSALRFQIPALRVPDVYLASHGCLATPDGWRTNRGTSYLNSLLFERPDREYYWHLGQSYGVTLQPHPRLLLALESQNDDDRSLPTLQESSAIFTPKKRFVNPSIDDGHLTSVVYRAELLSEPVRPEEIVSLFRSPDTSIVDRPLSPDGRSAYHLLATLEVGRLDSSERFDFTRFVGDAALFLSTGPQRGLSLAARLAGGSHLPLQRQEALGGWSALRGYDFKEFRGGDASLLGTIEYRHVWISTFADVGALHRPEGGWSGPHFGAGAKLHLDGFPVVGRWMRDKRVRPLFQLGCAWRLDQRTVARPEVRLLVGRAF